MQFSVAFTLALASVAVAAPGLLPELPTGNTNQPTGNTNHVDGSTDNTCGKDLELNCCNEVNESGDSTDIAQGILSGLDLADGTLANLFKGCSKLTVPVGVLGAGLGDFLNSQCKQTVACCQDTKGTKGTTQSGLINADVSPCVPLAGIL